MLAFNERFAAGAHATSPAEVIVVDGEIVAADSQARRLIGARTRRQVVGRDLSDFLAPGWTGADPTVDVRAEVATVVRLDGELEVVEWSSAPERWEGREAARLSFRPLATDPVRIRQLATGLAVTTDDAVVVADTRFGIRSFSPAAEELYRCRETDVLGRGLTDLIRVAPSGADRELGAVLQQLRRRGCWHGRAVQRRPAGGPFAAHLTANVVRDGGGKDLGTVWVIRRSDLDDDPFERAVVVDRDLDAEIPGALTRGEFTVRYQPMVALETLRVVGVEASVHWRHPDRGLLPPAYFFPGAVRVGLASALTRLLVGAAGRQQGRWASSGGAIPMAVKLTADQLHRDRVPDRLASALAGPLSPSDPASPPGNGWIEVAESALATDLHGTGERIRHCARRGLGIAVDDFGTSYAALAALRRLPVQRLKTSAKRISPSLMALAAELGVDVVATGVDTAAELDRVRRLGCPLGQGDLLGRAQPPEQLFFRD
jgi:PAS domain S-box-containing protein